jgi:hypothetical protein
MICLSINSCFLFPLHLLLPILLMLVLFLLGVDLLVKMAVTVKIRNDGRCDCEYNLQDIFTIH